MARGFSGILMLALGAVVLSGCASEELQTRIDQLERENIDLIAERDNQRRQGADALARLESANKQSAATAKELATARQQADEAADIASKYSQQNEKLIGELQGLRTQTDGQPRMGDSAALERARRAFEGGNGVDKVELDENGNIEITLESDVTFGSGRVSLTPAGKTSVRALKPLITGEYGSYNLRIVGHTDAEPLKKTKPLYEDNFGLGSRRALEVLRYLEKEMGIDPARLTSASRGAHQPVASNKTAEGRKQNRRVEVIVVIPRQDAIDQAQAQAK